MPLYCGDNPEGETTLKLPQAETCNRILGPGQRPTLQEVSDTSGRLTDIQPPPASQPQVAIQRLMDSSLHEPRRRLAEEACDVPNGNSFGQFGLGIPTPKQENNNWRETRLEEPNHEPERVHLFAVLSCGLCETK